MTTAAIISGTVRRAAGAGSSLITRFGEAVDVRNRGTLRAAKAAIAPAVVRLWHDDQCREMSSHEARALAAQLIAAANLADAQNGH
ncbi:MAG TPA: hypothetical protein VF472_11795 [Burkholderiaceae bacterium]